MDANELFCPNCRKLKKRCICNKKTLREKNLELYSQLCKKEKYRAIFDSSDYEIVFYRELESSSNPSVNINEIPVSDQLKKALELNNIKKLYRFQRDAFVKIMSGKDVIISAPTGSGKTEAFIIPSIERALREGFKVFAVYPTKALIRDQLPKIRHYARAVGLRVAEFHGDADRKDRYEVLSGKADIILTNPDMIDYHLRNTITLRNVIEEAGIFIFDELHSYSGYFGSNIYWLIKRIERFVHPQIIAGSATIDNPKEFGKLLFERDFEVVSGDERRGKVNLLIVYGDFYRTVLNLVRRLAGKKILIFGNSYKSVETTGWILEREGINAYVHKSGLNAEDRKAVEDGFKSGEIKVLVSTSTLELGVDIGDVDVVISEPVPFSNFLQRIGRAGRRSEGLGILVLRDEDTISNYYRKHPDEFFKEKAYCYAEKDNEIVKRYHILSMALEKPLFSDEISDEVVERMIQEGELIMAGNMLIAGKIRKNFSLRGIGKSVKIVENERVIGSRSLPIAVKELHPGAIFIHNKKKYRVVDLDLKNLEAFVIQENTRHITQPLYSAIPRIESVIERIATPVDACYCNMEITLFVTGYVKRDPFDDSSKTTEYLEKPVSYSFKTKGFIFSSPYPEKLDYEDFFAGSFHALEHVLIEASDTLTGGGSSGLGGISTPDGYIFVYDANEGGNGMSKILFSRLERAMKISLSVLENCECNRIDGCPRCTYSYQCGNNNSPLNRIGAIDALKKILSGVKRKTETKMFEDTRDFIYFP